MTQTYSSLSRKEKHYHLLYLIGMLVLVLVFLRVVLLRGYSSPFAAETFKEVEMLEQQYKFNFQQKKMEPFVVETFDKISALVFITPKPIEENEITRRIYQLSHAFAQTTIDDPRQAVYEQLASFYTMYLEDKKIIAKKTENIDLFRRQFEACSIGFKDKEQQVIQRKNSILTR